MNTLNLPHGLLLCTSFLACVLVLTLSYARTAQADVLGQKEAENMVLGNGATLSSGGDTVRFDSTGERIAQADLGRNGGQSVTATMLSNSAAGQSCVNLYLDNALSGSQKCTNSNSPPTERTWTGLNLNNSTDIQIRSANSHVMWVDVVRVDGTAPPVDTDSDGVVDTADNCPTAPNASQADIDADGTGDACDTQDNRDSDSDGLQNYADNCPNEAGPASNGGCPVVDAPPALGAQTGPQTITQDGWTGMLNVQCSGDPQSGAGTTTTGVNVSADNVHITNLRVRNCNTGLRTSGGASNLTIDAALFDHNKVSMRPTNLDGGNIGDHYGASSTTSANADFKIMDTYRAMESSQFQNVTFSGIYTDCLEGALGSWGTGAPNGGCHAGFKVLADRPNGGSHITRGWVMRDNTIKGVDDESISIDARLNTPSQQAYFGSDPTTAVNPQANTFTLNSGDWGTTGEDLSNYWATIVDGPNQCEVMDITARNGSTFTVDDPNDYLSGVNVGQRITIGEAYTDIDYVGNTVDWTTHQGKAAIDTHAGGCHVEVRDNTIIIPQQDGFAYNPQYFHYRSTGIGTATQAIDIRSAVVGSPTVGTTLYAPSSRASVTGNVIPQYGDISLSVVTWGKAQNFTARNYESGNQLGQGQAFGYLQNPLATDANP